MADTQGVVKPVPAAEAGCWIEGWWGQYGAARVVDIAAAYGWRDEVATDIARRHLATMGPSTASQITDDEYSILVDASDDAERWLTTNVAPEGYSFGWHDGEFFMQSEQWWEQES